ncbi:ABC transporter-like protein [Leptodontidium sp. 2 PMI_412]|nr:ABC transporter-like protein [Leptodontidium sp. 2 PMI_412]
MFPIPSERIRRQTLALTYKNFLIFSRSPFAIVFRTLLFPIILTLFLCFMDRLWTSSPSSGNGGVAPDALQIKTTQQVMDDVQMRQLAIVRNGITDPDLDRIIDSTVAWLPSGRYFVIDNVDDLFDSCQQTLKGYSVCFASIIFTSFNSTNIDYIISSGAMDSKAGSDYKLHKSFSGNRLMPLQWALDSQIGNFSSLARPLEQPWSGRMGLADPDAGKSSSLDNISDDSENLIYKIIYFFGAPVFVLVFIGAVYHLSFFVATERDIGMTELLAAQACTTTPRLLSNIISFTQFLFKHTSDALYLLMNLLGGISLTVFALFISSFFKKAQMAGLYTSILTIILSVLPTAFVFDDSASPAVLAVLSAIFPPFAYALMVADVARAEERQVAFSLLQKDLPVSPPGGNPVHPQIAGYSYILFFLLQTIAFAGAAYATERYIWGVKWNVEPIDSSSDIAVRCTNLTKRYKPRRRWWWPCSRVEGGCLAVNCLNLEMKKGSVNFLLGPNGGGKTTTLKCIAGIIPRDKVSKLEVNSDITSRDVCPQHNVFWEGLTVREHVDIWRRIKVAGVDTSFEVNDVLTECDILEKAHATANNLSGGMQRKLQLAIAFVGGSQLCFIDEASSGLDPLSRRNIWNIISQGTSRRTILMTTHFLDEADILADNISIIYKGRLIHQIKVDGDGIETSEEVWSTRTSAEATQKVLQLEEISDAEYAVTFPTLDDVFLKVTDSSIHEPLSLTQEVIARQDTENRELLASSSPSEITLEVGRMVNFSRQIWVLLRKRYLLLRHNWISLSISIGLPVLIAAALMSTVGKFPTFGKCSVNLATMRNASMAEQSSSQFTNSYVTLAPLSEPAFDLEGMGDSAVSAVVGPASEFQGTTQDSIYSSTAQDLFSTFSLGDFDSTTAKALATRPTAESVAEIITILQKDGGRPAFGIFAPGDGATTILHHMSNELGIADMSVITNRFANASTSTGTARKISTTYREMRHAENGGDVMNILLVVLVAVAFVCSTSISIMYPTFERINNVRALQYSNSVTPAALWIAYTIFDMHVGFIIYVVTWVLLFATNADKWFEPGQVLGAMFFYCLTSYLGVYVMPLFIRRASFAIAISVHLLLLIAYLVGYIVISSGVHPFNEQYQYVMLHTFFGISSPAANLLRAFFIAKNSFDVTCGLTGYENQSPFRFDLYGGVYSNFIFQISFLVTVLYLVEYGSSAWTAKLMFWKRSTTPQRLHYTVGVDDTTSPENIELATMRAKGFGTKTGSLPVLVVEKITKFFGSLFAVDEVSFDISPNETLALLGANGAGKTTTFNMIRGLIKPAYGSITIDSVDAIAHPQRARINLGVCPQDDAIDELSVRQTLDFFVSIKGLKNVKMNVDNILRAINISEFDDVLVTKLSGGARRKLMVAIALLGMKGQNIRSRIQEKVLWSVLQRFSSDRAILLTTHSMEEVSALASRVAIIGTKMLATGTLSELRDRYGGSYRVRATYSTSQCTSESDIRVLLNRTFGDEIRNLKMGFGEASFEVPFVRGRLGGIMRKMEGLMEVKNGERGVDLEDSRRMLLRDYTVVSPSMDEVFMNVMGERI